MGFLQRLLGQDPEQRVAEVDVGVRGRDWHEYDGTRKLSVVGESHYQAELMRVSGAPPSGEWTYDCMAELVLEPSNPHDEKAVMVHVAGECVGYLSRHNARRFHKRLCAMHDRGEPAMCVAWIGRRAEGNPNLGITLRIEYDGPLLS
jgi:hypothetical protein